MALACPVSAVACLGSDVFSWHHPPRLIQSAMSDVTLLLSRGTGTFAVVMMRHPHVRFCVFGFIKFARAHYFDAVVG